VNTTPKPKATKKSSGELVGPGDEDCVIVEVADVVVVVEEEEMRLAVVGVELESWDEVCAAYHLRVGISVSDIFDGE
jgi:hypothetical protein